MIFLATGYDGEPASIARPTNGLVIQNNNVGIGNFSTSDPSYDLHIADGGIGYATSSFRAPIFYDSGNTSYYLNGNTSNAWRIGTPSGYLDIGPMNTSWCHLQTDRPSFYFGQPVAFDGNISGYGGTETASFATYYDSNDTGYYVDPASTSNLNSVYINNLRIDGTTNGIYTSNTYLDLRYGSTLTGGVRLYDADNTIQGTWYAGGNGEHGFLDNDGSWAVRIRTGSNAMIQYCNGNPEFYVYTSYTYSPGSSRAPIFYDSNNTSYYANPNSTGTCYRGAGNILINGYITAGYSDERLKNIEGNIPNALDKVKALNGFYYKGNETAAKYDYDTEKTQVGLSAQEVEAVLPEIVTDAGIGNGFKTVDYAKVVPLLVEAIKEQQSQIEQLTTEIKSLKEK
jgi:hypothetical protein